MLFCPPGDSIKKRFFLSRNFARPFHFCSGGNGIRTHDTIFLYVDLANQCLKPLSHTSKLLIRIGCVGWLPEDPIHCLSRSARTLLYWARQTLSRSMDLPSIQARLHAPLTRWATPCFLWTPHHWMMNLASLRLRPDQERTHGQAKPPFLTCLNGIHISFV